MARFPSLPTAALALLSLAGAATAQCGSGSPEATVDGSGGSYTATVYGSVAYEGDYYTAIQSALDGITSGERVAVLADGAIGEGIVSITDGKIFEGCGTIDVGYVAGHGAIESLGTSGVSIPHLRMTGAPYFGLWFYGNSQLHLGEIVMELSGGLGIRFEAEEAGSTDVTMDSITVSGAGSHAVETWNIDGLTVGSVVATDVGECGLLLQTTTNARVGYVEGNNVASGTGYATLRFANRNGRLSDGSYATNVFVDEVVSTGGGRGVFCVSESGGAEIGTVSLADNGGNAVLIENCYGVSINGGTVNGGGEVRISSRDEFAVTSDVSITLEVNSNTVNENPCGENITWDITGDATVTVC